MHLLGTGLCPHILTHCLLPSQEISFQNKHLNLSAGSSLVSQPHITGPEDMQLFLCPYTSGHLKKSHLPYTTDRFCNIHLYKVGFRLKVNGNVLLRTLFPGLGLKFHFSTSMKSVLGLTLMTSRSARLATMHAWLWGGGLPCLINRPCVTGK